MIRRPHAILALLTALNLLNYLDRFVLSAVLPKVQEDLALSNFAAGWLATIFLLGYFATSPIFGYLADRGRRTWLMAAGVVVWSIATIASGLATNLAVLLIARAVVGVGEASYVTIAPTIIDDIAPADRKSRWLAVFYAAMPIGAALGFVVGGFVGKAWGWQNAFFVAGAPGALIAAACLFIAEPTKGHREKPRLVESFDKLRRIPLYGRAVLGYAAYTFAVGAFAFWAPKFLYARYHLDLATANLGFGGLTIVGGLIGTALGGFLGDRATKRRLARGENGKKSSVDGPYRGGHGEGAAEAATIDGNLRVCFWGSALGVPLAAGCFLAPSSTIFFALAFFTEIAIFLNTSPINAVVLRTVPMSLRASAMALSVFVIHLLGDLWSPPFVGILADHMPMQLAMMALPAAIGVSAWLWWRRS